MAMQIQLQQKQPPEVYQCMYLFNVTMDRNGNRYFPTYGMIGNMNVPFRLIHPELPEIFVGHPNEGKPLVFGWSKQKLQPETTALTNSSYFILNNVTKITLTIKLLSKTNNITKVSLVFGEKQNPIKEISLKTTEEEQNVEVQFNKPLVYTPMAIKVLDKIEDTEEYTVWYAINKWKFENQG